MPKGRKETQTHLIYGIWLTFDYFGYSDLSVENTQPCAMS